MGSPCESNPCRNGDCIATDGYSYVCRCYQGYTGLHCESGGLPYENKPPSLPPRHDINVVC